jgi:hypothetical protein
MQEEEGMRSRLLAGWRGLLAASAVASLVLIPTLIFGDEPTTVVNQGNTGFGPSNDAEAEDSIARPTLYARANYVWPFGTGPAYGLQGVDRSELRKPGMLHTQVGSFDLTRGMPQFPDALKAGDRLGELGAQYFLVQLHPDALSDDGVARLSQTVEAFGGKVVGTRPVSTFVARLNAEGLGAVQAHPGVMGVLPYHPAFKLSPLIGRIPLTDPYKAVSEVYTLDVLLHSGEDAGLVSEAIAKLGGNVTAVEPGYVQVELNRTKLAELASLEPVARVVESVPVFTKAEETTTTIQTGAYNGGSVPYHDNGIDGSGAGLVDPLTWGTGANGEQLIMILDTGIQLDGGDMSDTRVLPGTAGPAHRKVEHYVTDVFNMNGDLLGCDATISGGSTHGHTVAATATGLATGVDEGTYGTGWQAIDEEGNPWSLDGVAPGARVLAYDAQETPNVLNCDDPGAGGLVVGTTYNRAGGTGSLFDGYDREARISNFSWGALQTPQYDLQAQRVDQFLFDHRDAMVFIAAGNEGSDTNNDGIPDPGTVSSPATAKNAVVVGASYNANDTGTGATANSRTGFSSVGPAVPADSLLRVAPLLMAPGDDQFSLGNMGVDSEFHCRTQDNDQDAPVECDLVRGLSGTSFASPAAAGAGLLIRDYFNQGFYPDGSTSNPSNEADQAEFVSGALVKAMLVASADFMTGGGLTEGFRFNNEQGYGRVQLTHILPLSESIGAQTPIGLVVADHNNVSPPLIGLNSTSLSGAAQNQTVEEYSFKIRFTDEELRVACAWIEDVPDAGDGMLDNNIDIELEAPDGTTYFGNLFTEDKDRDNVLDPDEDCDGDGEITEGGWSLIGTGATTTGTPVGVGESMTCTTANTFAHDDSNPTEAIFLSPDPEGDGIEDDPDTAEDESVDNMIQPGTWTLRVIGEVIVAGGPAFQPYACVVGGPVAPPSAVRFDSGGYVCNDESSIRVAEQDPDPEPDGDNDTNLHNAGSPAARAAVVGDRVVLQVLDGDTVVDEEGCGNNVTKPCLVFEEPTYLRYDLVTPLSMTDGLTRSAAATWYNGVIDVRNGETLKVTYYDETAGVRDPEKVRFNTAGVDCSVSLGFGGFTWTQFGLDSAVLVDGGCERDARGLFTYGHPDKYMDEDEKLGFRIVFQSTETSIDLRDATATLSCVLADADSPVTCRPGTPATTACPDPDRTNNPPCEDAGQPLMTIADPTLTIGLLPAGNFVSSNFAIEMADTISGTFEVEMLLGVAATSSGKPVEGLVASRQIVNADERSFNYNTDFPTGGVETRDYVNDEVIENPITVPGGSVIGNDYRFEQVTWDDLTLTGKNQFIDSPWDFEGGEQGFTVGLHTATDLSITSNITNWGEDFNFNGVLDPGEDRDPTGNPGGAPDTNWSDEGGCGWQSTSDPFTAGLTGGVWHTGTIDQTTLASCFGPGANRQCQSFETVGGGGGALTWMELLKTPIVQKVNQCGAGECAGNPTIACETAQDCTDAGTTGPCNPTADPLCGTRRDAPGAPVFTVEFIDWAWNMALELPDLLSTMTWELDTDVASVNPSNLDAFPVLNLMGGPQGAVSGGNAPITDGFQLFAPTHVCALNSAVTCADDPDCDPPNFDPSIGPCVDVQQTVNGKFGLSRVGRNSCFFNGPTELPAGVAKPRDDDQNNSGLAGCCVADPLCQFINGEWTDTGGALSCLTDIDCALGGFTSPRSCSAIDGFVTQTGPIRNMDIQKVNGPDMRLGTLEDIYGLSGSSFQGAIGLITDEGTIGTQPISGFGLAIDDMSMSWREFDLQEDTTTCDPASGGGSCASVEIEQTRLFEGSTTVNITILDQYPNNLNNFTCSVTPQACVANTDCPGVETCNLGAPWTEDDVNNCNLNSVCENNGAASCGSGSECGFCEDLSTFCTSDADCTGIGGETCDTAADGTDCQPVFTDPGDDNDCNDNGIVDIVTRVTSESLDSEILVLDEVSPGIYTGTQSVSSSYDVDPGVLFLSASGTDNPAVIVQYSDYDDGTGYKCGNDTDPAVAGTVQATSTVFLTRGTVIVKGAAISNSITCTAPNDPVGCNGDGDVFADTNETNEMRLTIINKTGIDLNRVVARVNTGDTDKIDCILTPFVNIGPLLEDEERTVDDPIVFKVRSDANRANVTDPYNATFTVTMTADEFDALLRTQEVLIPLDLDVVSDTGVPQPYSEGFEGGSIASSSMTEMPMDELPGPDQEDMLLQSDGFRCQYNDCGGPNPNGGPDNPNCPDCFLGFLNIADNAYDWQVHTTGSPDGGRAFTGNNSLHYGKEGSIPDLDTSRLKQLDAIRTDAPINLPVDTIPELVFKHQVSLMDYRGSNTPFGESVDRGVVHVQLADLGGTGVGIWEKVFPYQNVYDVQGTDAFINCKFDPIDDGNDEDDYFDPSDPLRRLGPSSTCFPEFVFGFQGDTDWRNTFNSLSIGRATDPPGLPGSIDRGTWVETRFNLATKIGQRIRFRFLFTSIEVGDAIDHMEANIADPNDVHDDGWYIDQIEIAEAISSPVILAVDSKNYTDTPICGAECGTVTADIVADPPGLSAPGQVTELSAEGSFADQCTGGVLQFQFWEDANANDVLGDPVDNLLRDWTDNPIFVAAPALTTTYGVAVRCSTTPDQTSCNQATTTQVVVTCPAFVAFKGADEPMTEHIRFRADKTTLEWNTVQFVDVQRGNLDNLRTDANFTNAADSCIANDANANSVATLADPTTFDFFYLVRGRSLMLTTCNEIGGYTVPSESGDRDTELGPSPANTCP